MKFRRLILWLALHLPETRITPRLMAIGLGASSVEKLDGPQ